MAVHLVTCVCIAVCTRTPGLSSTLHSLLELCLSVFLVVILTHPRLCTVSVVAPYRAVYLRCGLEAFGVCLWRGHAYVPLFLAIAMHSRVGRFRQAQALHMSLASVMHSCVARFRQAMPMRMFLATVMHISLFLDTPGVWRQVSRHQHSVGTARIYAHIYICPGACAKNTHMPCSLRLPLSTPWTTFADPAG